MPATVFRVIQYINVTSHLWSNMRNRVAFNVLLHVFQLSPVHFYGCFFQTPHDALRFQLLHCCISLSQECVFDASFSGCEDGSLLFDVSSSAVSVSLVGSFCEAELLSALRLNWMARIRSWSGPWFCVSGVPWSTSTKILSMKRYTTKCWNTTVNCKVTHEKRA